MTSRLALAAALILTGCSVEITSSSPLTTAVSVFRADGMAFTASAQLSGGADRTLSVSVHVQNEDEVARQSSILGGNCMIRVRLYDASKGTDVWSQFDEIDACQEPLRVFDLDPGEADSVSTQVDVPVGSGTYLVTATIEHLAGFPSSFVELIAGNVTFP